MAGDFSSDFSSDFSRVPVEGTGEATLSLETEAIGSHLGAGEGAGLGRIKITAEATGQHIAPVVGVGAAIVAVISAAEAEFEAEQPVAPPAVAHGGAWASPTWSAEKWLDREIRRRKKVLVSGEGRAYIILTAQAKGEVRSAVTGKGSAQVINLAEAQAEFFDAVGEDNNFMLAA